MANNLEHFWFLKYSLAVKTFLKDSLYLKKYPSDKNVSVYYTTPARAFAKFIVPVINGSNLNPTATFYLTSNTPKQGETPVGYFKKYQQSKDNNKVWVGKFKEIKDGQNGKWILSNQKKGKKSNISFHYRFTPLILGTLKHMAILSYS